MYPCDNPTLSTNMFENYSYSCGLCAKKHKTLKKQQNM